MEPSVLGSAFTEGGPDRKIKLDRNPGIDEVISRWFFIFLFYVSMLFFLP